MSILFTKRDAGQAVPFWTSKLLTTIFSCALKFMATVKLKLNNRYRPGIRDSRRESRQLFDR